MDRKLVDRKQLSPMMLQYMEIKDNYEDIIVFFRLGDFYEMFFDDAITCSHELSLTLTGKNAGLSERIPMCGVPKHSKDIYIKRLCEKGYKVAICEQSEDASSAKGIVKREVVSIITTATNMNIEDIDSSSNNFLASITYTDKYYISYIDVTTGNFYANSFTDKDDLFKEIRVLDIKEIVVRNDLDANIVKHLKEDMDILVTYFNNLNFTLKYDELLKDLDPYYKDTAKLLLTYIDSVLMKDIIHIKPCEEVINSSYMQMDLNCINSLNLIKNSKTLKYEDTLYSHLNKTKTASGSRLLKSIIEKPLIIKEDINKRYDIIEIFSNEFIYREEISELLYNIYDIERLASKISYGNVLPKDLVNLRNSLLYLPRIKELIENVNLSDTFRINTLSEVFDLLDSSIKLDCVNNLREGNIIKPGFNELLDEYIGIRSNSKDFLLKFEEEEKAKTNIKTLKVSYNKIFGYYIEVSRKDSTLIKDEYGYERKQTLANCERYITPLLKEKEALIFSLEEKIVNLEFELFNNIKEELLKYIKDFQELSLELAYLDVMVSFSYVSDINGYVRPIIHDENSIVIKDGYHPIAYEKLKEKFVKNDCTLNDDRSLLLITGPNMAGKSTYLRMIAIIQIMTQIGMFAPASFVETKIVDKIFTRIGASDDLSNGESTFMVEMLDCTYAIKNATNNSLILFDELGRGTSTFDGMSIATSILEYIASDIKAFVLFSTHYHELTSLEGKIDGLKNIYVDAKEDGDNLVFNHKIKDGAASSSYGINVAKLSGINDTIIKRASNILSEYEKEETLNYKNSSITQKDEVFCDNESEVIKLIKDIDVNNMTGLDCLNKINELKSIINK